MAAAYDHSEIRMCCWRSCKAGQVKYVPISQIKSQIGIKSKTKKIVFLVGTSFRILNSIWMILSTSSWNVSIFNILVYPYKLTRWVCPWRQCEYLVILQCGIVTDCKSACACVHVQECMYPVIVQVAHNSLPRGTYILWFRQIYFIIWKIYFLL